MNYVTTNIRIPEEDYLVLKQEALAKRISFAGVVRQKLSISKKKRSKKEIDEMMARLDSSGKKLGKKLRGFDSVKALREIRYEQA